MRVENYTKKLVLAEDTKILDDKTSRMVGLMFSQRVVPCAFFFGKMGRYQLHSWFCPDNIDVVFVDDSWQVVDVLESWRVNQKHEPKKPFYIVVELPTGSIKSSNVVVGDYLRFYS